MDDQAEPTTAEEWAAAIQKSMDKAPDANKTAFAQLYMAGQVNRCAQLALKNASQIKEDTQRQQQTDAILAAQTTLTDYFKSPGCADALTKKDAGEFNSDEAKILEFCNNAKSGTFPPTPAPAPA